MTNFVVLRLYARQVRHLMYRGKTCIFATCNSNHLWCSYLMLTFMEIQNVHLIDKTRNGLGTK